MIKPLSIEVSIHTLMEILEKTGNPALAAKILDGTYTEPEIDKSRKALVVRNTESTATTIEPVSFVSYEKWNNTVVASTVRGFNKHFGLEEWSNLELFIEPSAPTDEAGPQEVLH